MEDSTDINAHRLLQSIYRDEEVALPVRMRAAIESLPYETPKLSATAIAAFDGQTFAEALERAISRSQQPVPLLNGPVEELPASELKSPLSDRIIEGSSAQKKPPPLLRAALSEFQSFSD